jgi:hypothetical protein
MRNRQPAIERKNLGTEAGLSKQLDIARNTAEVHFATVRESDGSNHQLLLRANHSEFPAGADIVGFEQQDSVRSKSVSACLEYLQLLFIRQEVENVQNTDRLKVPFSDLINRSEPVLDILEPSRASARNVDLGSRWVDTQNPSTVCSKGQHVCKKPVSAAHIQDRASRGNVGGNSLQRG